MSRIQNPDLPILDELGAEFRALVAAELGGPMASGAPGLRGHAAPGSRAPARRRVGRPRARRVARRTGIVLAMLCLIGGVALAARFGGGGPPANTDPVRLAANRDFGWTLSAYRDEGRLCASLAIGSLPAADCSRALGADGVQPTSALGAGDRFVFGLAGTAVARVRVMANGWQGVADTVAIDGDDAAASGLPAGMRWFVVPLPGHGAAGPALVVPLDGRGHRLGRASLDCSLGAVGAACERAIDARARRALR